MKTNENEYKNDYVEDKIDVNAFKQFSEEDFDFHWAFRTAKEIIKRFPNESKYVVASGITPSGTVHIGNFREIITVDLVAKALKVLGKDVRFIYIWDDYDVFRKVPKNFPEQELLKEHLRMPLTSVPDVFKCHENYARHNEAPVEELLPIVYIFPEFIYQNEKYKACEYRELIKTAFENEQKIKDILNKFRKEPLPDSWHVANVYCEKCNKETTDVEYLGGYRLKYRCHNCGYENEIDFSKQGIVKMRWRVDWPFRWKHYNVLFEPGGKDHSTVGGSYDTSKIIIREIFNREPPVYLMYDWVTIKGQGGKISSSLGNVITLKEVLEIYEPVLVRYLFAGTRPNTEFAISFDQDVLKIYEEFDKIERVYYGLEKVENKKKEKQLKLIYLLSVVRPNKTMPVQISFRHLTTLVQIFNYDVDKVVTYFEKDQKLDDYSRERLIARAKCAINWIKKYAPEQFKFEIKEIDEERFKTIMEQFDVDDKIISVIKKMLEKRKELDADELQQFIFENIKALGKNMKEFFKLNYMILINKTQGPRLGRFLKDLSDDQIKMTYENFLRFYEIKN